jgi:hypothetical protein
VYFLASTALIDACFSNTAPRKEAAMRRFMIRPFALPTIAIALGGACCSATQAQNVPGYWAGDVSLAPTAEENLNQPSRSDSPSAAAPRVAPARASGNEIAIPVQTRQALGFYGGRSAMATLNELPRNTAYQAAQNTAPQPARRPTKPFQTASNRPALSPYLNLFRDDKSTTGIPNYYQYVQPQLEQQAAEQRQQIQSERRERQGRAASNMNGGLAAGAAQPEPNTPAHFMDTAQYYGAWRR